MTRHVLPGVLLMLAGCGGGPESVVPVDFRTAWAEVQPCQESVEHDMQFVRVRANGLAEGAYAGSGGGGALPEGATVVKEEFLDARCQTPLGLTAMRKESGAWRWQRLSLAREVLEDGDLRRCASCHARCGEGRDGVCSAPTAAASSATGSAAASRSASRTRTR